MTLYGGAGPIWLMHADCVEAMRGMAPNSFDAIVCDPPYGLEFMGKEWDRLDGPTGGAGFTEDGMGKGFNALPSYRGNTNPTCANCKGTKRGNDRKGFRRCRCDKPSFPNDGKRQGEAQQAWHEEWAREALRVLKPGGHLLAFGGTRTYHRLACAIEDVGFEVRDSLAWMYGCLDDQTEALTRRGWVKGVDLRPDDEVCQWAENGTRLSWVRPQRIIVKPYTGDLVVMKNRHVEMHLTPDHRVPMWLKKHQREVATPFVVEKAGDVKSHWQKTIPVAGRLDGSVEIDPKLAYLVGWWLTDAWAHPGGKAVMFSQAKPKTLTKLRLALAPYTSSEYVKRGREAQHADEHTFYVTGPLAEYLLQNFPTRRLLWEVLSWSREARLALFSGLMDGDGSQRDGQHAHAFWSQSQERRDVFTALCVSLGFRAYDDAANGCVHVNIATGTTQLQAKHKVTTRPYSGLVWCVTVPTGFFVARRNGRPFVTGNSGFPKSLDVAREIEMDLCQLSGRHYDKTLPTGVKAQPGDHLCPTMPEVQDYFGGRGTALKPSFEPVVLARKALDGTVADNVRKWGTGALNIGASRVGTLKDVPASLSRTAGVSLSGSIDGLLRRETGAESGRDPNVGRWPANVMLDEEAAAMLDAQSGIRRAGHTPKARVGSKAVAGPVGHSGQEGIDEVQWGAGGASRFFYCAKASRSEREAGLEHLPARAGAEAVDREEGSAGTKSPRAGAGRTAAHVRNHHPTVKPIAVMEWLVRLVTPPGGLVLDPFAGSGTTGLACQRVGARFLGIEREEEYVTIARARLKL